MRREILFILTALLLVNLINAQQQSLGTFKADGCINLIQTCGSCTYNIITSVQSPNSTTLLFNQSMNKNGTEYTYPFCNTSDLGIYIVNGVGDLDGEEIVWVYDFEITATGKDLTSV